MFNMSLVRGDRYLSQLEPASRSLQARHCPLKIEHFLRDGNQKRYLSFTKTAKADEHVNTADLNVRFEDTSDAFNMRCTRLVMADSLGDAVLKAFEWEPLKSGLIQR